MNLSEKHPARENALSSGNRVSKLVFAILGGLLILLPVQDFAAATPKTKAVARAPHTSARSIRRAGPRQSHAPKQAKEEAPDCAPVFLLEAEAVHADVEPLVVFHTPTCRQVWINPDETAGFRELPPNYGPVGAKTELFFHDVRVLYVWEDPEDVARSIAGLVVLHGTEGLRVWIRAQEITGIRYPVEGILGDSEAAKTVRSEVFMHDINSKFVRESPPEVAALVAAALKQK
jgi:hypothetical protein